jgi:hypothetical protein
MVSRLKMKWASSRVRERGISIQNWLPVFEASFREELDRDPTPAEIDLEMQMIEALLRRQIQHKILSKEASRDVPITRGDLSRVKILGYQTFSEKNVKLFLDEELKGLILCRERDVCFIPEIDEVESSNQIEKGECSIRISGGARSRSKSTTACPVFRDHPEHWITIPYPMITRDEQRTRLIWIHRTREGIEVRSHIIHHTELEITEPDSTGS